MGGASPGGWGKVLGPAKLCKGVGLRGSAEGRKKKKRAGQNFH